MRWLWRGLAVVAGAIIAAAVWLSGQGPAWRSPPRAGQLEGFSPDGAMLVTSYSPSLVGANPEVSRWDAVTGRLLGRTTFPCADPNRIKSVRPSADGRKALVGEGESVSPTRADFYSGDWYLHDGFTGERQAGPIRGVSGVFPQDFSPDGRWVYAIHSEPVDKDKPPLSGKWTLHILSASTGEVIVRAGVRDRRYPLACYFAPDGDTAAISWSYQDEQSGARRRMIRIFELPSGRERRRFDLPQRSWVRVDHWDGRFLEAVASVADDPSGAVWQSYVFDLSKEPVGEGFEDPLLRGMGSGRNAPPQFWLHGEDWVGQFSFLPADDPRPAVFAWWDRIAARVGLRRPPSGTWVSARLIDRATGQVRYEAPTPIGYPPRVSPDGRWLACSHDSESIEVWDTKRRPRWPEAFAAGMVAGGGVLLLGRWRRRYCNAGT